MRCWSDAIAGRVLSIVLVSWFLPGDCSIAAQPNKVRISYSSRSNSNTPFIIALNKGFFVEEGIDVELIQVNPRLGATAVLNGDLDFTTTFGTTLRGIISGFPIKFVAVAVKKSEHFLVVRPEIKEIRDLNGKKLGVSTLFGLGSARRRRNDQRQGIRAEPDEADRAGRVAGPSAGSARRFGRCHFDFIAIRSQLEIRRLSRPGGPARRPDCAAHVWLGSGQSRVAAEPAARQASGARLDEVASLRV
jgi:ABC-type nitrate/sulfonate/bicarbonate transport system substrate-binding protein